ncbi:hypothetical protein VNO77_22476 [Canavalia gladiata]|uniref:Uncharacterized protein n=1 Tax=Canavalia gladiata TaxID=3824 RepID=A0AAN9QAL3_CANGL
MWKRGILLIVNPKYPNDVAWSLAVRYHMLLRSVRHTVAETLSKWDSKTKGTELAKGGFWFEGLMIP